MRSRGTYLFCAVIFGAVTAVACSGSSGSLLPTGPSGTGQAQITGRITTAPTSGSASTVSLAGLTGSPLASVTTSARLTVSISGTNIATSVDGAGNFTLDGVPPGTVTIDFTGSNVRASVTLSGVTDGDRIDIDVRIDATGARIESERRDRETDAAGDDDDDRDGTARTGDDDAGEVHGAVSDLAGTCPAITFAVDARRVATSAATTFADTTCAQIVDGTRVEADGSLMSDGTLAATRVEADD